MVCTERVGAIAGFPVQARARAIRILARRTRRAVIATRHRRGQANRHAAAVDHDVRALPRSKDARPSGLVDDRRAVCCLAMGRRVIHTPLSIICMENYC